MSTINRLSSVDALQPGDLMPIWDGSNGDTRKASMTTLLAYITSNFTDPDYTTRIIAPSATGFTIDAGSTGDSLWLIVNPVAGYASGSLWLPPATSAVDGQEIVATFTEAVETLSVTSVGATVSGLNVGVGANDNFRLRYNAVQLTWYAIAKAPTLLPFVTVEEFGAVGDWDYATQTGTDDTAAIQAAIDFCELVASNANAIALTPGKSYRATALLRAQGAVVIMALGGVPGSSANRGARIVADHTGGGIIFDGYNAASTQEGSGCGLAGVMVEKAGGRNGGTAVEFYTTDNSNVVGFTVMEDTLVIGASSSGVNGEGLWAKGIVLDGTNQDIGIKNHSWRNVGVTGVSGDDQYVVATSAVQWNWTDGYIRDASASFPSAGNVGVTIDSAGAASSDLIFWNNVLTLGSIVFGEVTHFYATNCQCSQFQFTDHAGGASIISWVGGEFANGYSGVANRSAMTATWQLHIETSTVRVNEFTQMQSLTGSQSLTAEDARHPVNNNGAGAAITLTLPELSSGLDYEFDLQNVESFDLIIDTTATDSFYNSSVITSITLNEGDRMVFRNRATTTSQWWYWEVIVGQPTLTGFGHINFDGSYYMVSSRVLTNDWLDRPVDGRVWALDAGLANRDLSTNNSMYPVGFILTVVNIGAANTLTFDYLGIATVIGVGVSKDFIYTGSVWINRT